MKTICTSVILAICCANLAAQDEKLKIGDKVRVAVSGREFEATITEFKPFGRIGIEFMLEGKPGRLTIDKTHILTVAEKAGPTQPARPTNPLEAAIDMQPSRTWTDASGKFSIDATFESLEDNQVVLRTSDGKIKKIAFDKLSKPDQDYVQGLQSALGVLKGFMDEEEAESNPVNISDGVKTQYLDFQKASVIRLRDTKAINLSESANKGCVLEPLITTPEWQSFQEGAQLLGTEDFGRWQKVFFGRDRTKCLALMSARLRAPGPASMGFVCDFSKGTVGAPIGFFGECENPIAYEPEGNLVAISPIFKHRVPLQICEIVDGKDLRLVKSLALPEGVPVLDAKFLDKNRLVAEIAGDLVLIDIDRGEIVSRLSSTIDWRVEPTPSGRYAIAYSKDRVVVVDLVQNKVAGSLSLDPRLLTKFCFRPDGRHLACFNGNVVTIWDVANDCLVEEFSIANPYTAFDSSYLTNDLLLVGGKALVSIPLKSDIWWYVFSFSEFGQISADGKIVVGFEASDDFSLLTMTIPDTPARETIAGLTVNDTVFLKPGDSISIETSDGPARTYLEQMLTKAGFKVVANADTVMKLVEGDVRQYRGEYIGFGDDPKESEFVEHATQHIELAIFQGGKKVWWVEGGKGNVRSMIDRRPGETLQQYFDRNPTSELEFVQRIELRGVVSRRGPNGWYGQTFIPPRESR